MLYYKSVKQTMHTYSLAYSLKNKIFNKALNSSCLILKYFLNNLKFAIAKFAIAEYTLARLALIEFSIAKFELVSCKDFLHLAI